jgi:UDP-glucose 4-epimerase
MSSGYDVLVVDDLSNSQKSSIEKVHNISNSNIEFEVFDITNTAKLKSVFLKFRPQAVIHLAGKKSVPESITQPLQYYSTNVAGTISVLHAMEAADCKQIVFSSSATVYGTPLYVPIDELHPTAPTNPYGMSKLMSENIIRDWCELDEGRTAVILRYFNPIGADKSGHLFEVGASKSTNLMPKLLQAAFDTSNELTIFQNNHKTPDCSGVRDYIHVNDLAAAHLSAVNLLDSLEKFSIFNIGTGIPTSVLQLIKTFEKINNVSISKRYSQLRPGDVPEVWASATKANQNLKWKAMRNIDDMCKDSWLAFLKQNSDQY